MKRLLLLLLICLLPVRAIGAEVMGLGMALPATAAGAVSDVAATAMPADCPMMKMAGKAAMPDGGKGCKACQLCMEVAGVAAAASGHPCPTSERPVRPVHEEFASAELVALTEPPRTAIPRH